jgi:flagellar basal-body rod modification protein FlgD
MEIGSSAAAATAATQSRTATSDPKRAGAITSDFQTFLKMLTAQIQNQDPLNPTPSDEFAVQLATFSSVEQQVKTNDLLTALGAQFGDMGMAQFAGWVGMEARAAAPVAFRGAPITLSPNPAQGADRADLVVRNSAGREVERVTVPASTEPLVWAGIGPNGSPYMNDTYSFELVSFKEGVPFASTTVEAYGRVREVRGEGGQTMIVLDGGASLPASQVTGLRQPA